VKNELTDDKIFTVAKNTQGFDFRMNGNCVRGGEGPRCTTVSFEGFVDEGIGGVGLNAFINF
jgi:hypothetical protein